MYSAFKNGWAYCKYCYSNRRDWQASGEHDLGVFICPNCRHASKLYWSEDEVEGLEEHFPSFRSSLRCLKSRPKRG